MLRIYARGVLWAAVVASFLGCAKTNGDDNGFGPSGNGNGGSSGSGAGNLDSSADSTVVGSSSGYSSPPPNNDSGGLQLAPMDAMATCPSTCAALNANCGAAVTDTICGGTVNCGTCEAGMLCGSVTPNQCGPGSTSNPDSDGASCTPLTCAAQGIQCGPAGDGCGNMIQCGTGCPSWQTCGGGGSPGKCGCSGVCANIPVCEAGTTTLTGTVMDPGGVNPLYNVLVYIPNDPNDPGLQPFPMRSGSTCDVCGASAAGSPLVSTNTLADGTFSLSGVPVGQNVTLVIQLGRWRRQFQVNIPNPCTSNMVTGTGGDDAGPTSIANGILTMPKNKSEGDIPFVAVVTGDADAMECVFWKMGIDAAEFTDPGGTGRINLMQGSGHGTGPAGDRSTACTCGGAPSSCTNNNGACTEADGGASTCACQNFGGGAVVDTNTPTEMVLYQGSDADGGAAYPVSDYDMTVLSCQSWPWGPANQPSLNHWPELVEYTNNGGRLFASHFSSTYFTTGGNGNAFDGTANWGGPGVTDLAPAMPGYFDTFVDTNTADNPKATAFATWLNTVGAISPTPAWMTNPANDPTVIIQQAKSDTASVIAPTQQWMFVSPKNDLTKTPPVAPLFFSFNTPIGAANTAQCGRGLYSDFHVTPNNMALDGKNGTHGLVFPAECGNRSPMTAQEKVLEFMLFDLGSCVEPYQPLCTPTTCTAQNIQCGPAGDGCGNALDCGPCPTGETCGGGGTPGVCGTNMTGTKCTPLTCAGQSIQCGPAGDGCGNALDCGPCPAGDICGYGGPGKCGSNK